MGFLSRWFGSDQVTPSAVRSSADLASLVQGELPVIVDVWSPTCAPCKKLAPVLTEVATRYGGRVAVAEVDASAAEPALLRSLRVQATPTVIIFRGGAEIGRVTGFRPPSWFDEMIAVELG